MAKPTKAQIRKERSPAKLKKVLKRKGYPKGKLPIGKVAHHVKAVAENGKTTTNNIRVITMVKHNKIHKNRRKRRQVWQLSKLKTMTVISGLLILNRGLIRKLKSLIL